MKPIGVNSKFTRVFSSNGNNSSSRSGSGGTDLKILWSFIVRTKEKDSNLAYLYSVFLLSEKFLVEITISTKGGSTRRGGFRRQVKKEVGSVPPPFLNEVSREGYLEVYI